jgi:hypothetical protein
MVEAVILSCEQKPVLAAGGARGLKGDEGQHIMHSQIYFEP